ncbi:MAG: Resolvase domain protein [Firmicutes bacterium]|nr:Resolvase domain protein [Bacillota bacterium]
MNVAAIYRVSTEKQVKRDGDHTIPLQRAAVRTFIAQNPAWTLVTEYTEEGVSGFKVSANDRDVLQQAFRDAKTGLWQVLIVFKADRLSRNALEYPIVIDRFRRIGCDIWSVTDAAGGKLLALDTQMDKFVRFLEGWQAETESKNTSIRVSEAMLQLARQGRWSGGPPPYGFRLNPQRRPKSDTPALLIDAGQAEIINMMVDLYLAERLGCLQIARELTRRAVPNPSGRPWDDQKVRRVLQNPIIAGLPAYGRHRQSGGRHYTRKNPYDLDQFVLPRDDAGSLRPVPAYQIVPLDRWLQLLRAMQSARAQPAQPTARHTLTRGARSAGALLTGLLFCGHCGARLSAGGAGQTRRRYYICQTHSHRGRPFCDGQRTYGARRLEGVITSQVARLLLFLDDDDLGSRLTYSEAQVSHGRRLQEGLQRAERVLAGWLTLMDTFLASPADSPYSEELLAAKIREARARKAQAEALYAQMPPRRALPPLAESARWWHCFAGAPTSAQKLLLRDLIERINIRRDAVEIVFRIELVAFLPPAPALSLTDDG